MVALIGEEGASWESRWYPVNNDAVGIVALCKGEMPEGDIPDWTIDRYVDTSCWVAADIMVPEETAATRYRFPTAKPESVTDPVMPHRSDPIDNIGKGVKDVADDYNRAFLSELPDMGFNPQVIAHPSVENDRLHVRVTSKDGDPISLKTKVGDDQWMVLVDGYAPASVEQDDLILFLYRL